MYEYDIVIIGGGSGGLVAASSAAQLGLNVLLIEKERLGGDCLWYGCVPSKALLSSAKRAHDVRSAEVVGLPPVREYTVDLASVMRRLRSVQKRIEPHDSPARFRRLGVTVLFGSPSFTGRHELKVNERRISFKYAIIATGSSPRTLGVRGLDETGFLTNLTIFSLERLPKHLVVIGGGPIGIEMAQAFARLGSKVTVLVRSRLLPKEDPRLVRLLQNRLVKEGVSFLFGTVPERVSRVRGRKRVVLSGRRRGSVTCDEILVAVGRVPNVEGLGLERAGVRYSGRGIEVDPFLRTTSRNIYAIGDVVGGLQFTHMAASHASTAIRNIIMPVFKTRAELSVVPWVTYTDPELARVGRIPSQLEGVEHEELVFPFKRNDRALAEEKVSGEIRVVVTPKGEILGASILGPNAGELIMEYALAMKHGLSIKDLAATIHPYPTLSGSTWSLAGSYYKRFLTPRVRWLTRFLVRYL